MINEYDIEGRSGDLGPYERLGLRLTGLAYEAETRDSWGRGVMVWQPRVCKQHYPRHEGALMTLVPDFMMSMCRVNFAKHNYWLFPLSLR